MRQLSQMLRAAPRPAFPPAREFKAQVMLQLPRQVHPQPSNGKSQELPPNASASLLPFAAPALILVGWLFIETLAGLLTLLSLGGQAGLVDSLSAWLGGSQQMLWLSGLQTTLGMLGSGGQAGLSLLDGFGQFATGILLVLAWQAAVALLYWGALILAWREQRKTPVFSSLEG